MPQVPLTHCPDCGYSLQGLPARHRCPECGFEYDEHTRVWKPARPWKVVLGLALNIPAFALWGVSEIRTLLRGRSLRLDEMLLLCSMTILLVALVIQLLRYRRAIMRGRFVAITPRGIVARVRPQIDEIPWLAIRAIRRHSDGRINLICTDEITPTVEERVLRGDQLGPIIDPRKDRDDFFKHAREALQRYDSSQAARPHAGPS